MVVFYNFFNLVEAFNVGQDAVAQCGVAFDDFILCLLQVLDKWTSLGALVAWSRYKVPMCHGMPVWKNKNLWNVSAFQRFLGRADHSELFRFFVLRMQMQGKKHIKIEHLASIFNAADAFLGRKRWWYMSGQFALVLTILSQCFRTGNEYCR